MNVCIIFFLAVSVAGASSAGASDAPKSDGNPASTDQTTEPDEKLDTLNRIDLGMGFEPRMKKVHSLPDLLQVHERGNYYAPGYNFAQPTALGQDFFPFRLKEKICELLNWVNDREDLLTNKAKIAEKVATYLTDQERGDLAEKFIESADAAIEEFYTAMKAKGLKPRSSRLHKLIAGILAIHSNVKVPDSFFAAVTGEQ